MNISCGIIKDLLPLYHDAVCSNESRILIEEHLSQCDNCKAELMSMDEVLTINNTDQNINEASTVKSLSQRWKKGMLKSLLKGVFLTVLTVVIIVLFLYLFVDIKIG